MQWRVLLLVSVVASLLVPVPATAQEGTGGIHGTITLDSPVPFKIMVTLYDGLGAEIASGPTFAESGRFAIEGLSPGSYKLRLGGEWYDSKPSLEEADVVTVEAGLPTSIAAEMTVAELGRIEGRVYDGVSGEGIPCVNVIGARPYVGDDGTYGIYLSPGRWTVDFVDVCRFEYEPQWWNGKTSQAEADPLTVVAGQTLAGIDAAMRLPTDPGGWISGTVYDTETGETIPGICATPFDESGNVLQARPDYLVSGPTNWDGKYRLGFLGEGNLRLLFTDCRFFAWESKWWRDASEFDLADPLTVTLGEEVSGVDIALTLRPGAVRPTEPPATPPATTAPNAGVLPFTGESSTGVAVLAGLVLIIGVLTVRSARE